RTTKLTRGCPEVVNGSVGSDRGRNPTTLHHPREANPWRSFSSSVAEREKTEEEDDAVKIYEQRWFVRARRLRIISPTVVFSLLLEMRGCSSLYLFSMIIRVEIRAADSGDD
ncbi:unnamed protein product, partial [Brassica napus]